MNNYATVGRLTSGFMLGVLLTTTGLARDMTPDNFRERASHGQLRHAAVCARSSEPGSAGLSSLGGRGSADTCLKAIATAVSPSNGTAPLSSS